MKPRYALIVLLVAWQVLVVPRAPLSAGPGAEPPRAPISRSGTLGGADYLIEVPANWRGGLVVFAHGVQRGPGPGTVGAPPIGSHIVAQGHAWIASGFRAREYQPHLFIEDLVALRELFLNEIGQPRWTIIYGQALGGARRRRIAGAAARPLPGRTGGVRRRRRDQHRRLPAGLYRRGRAHRRRAAARCSQPAELRADAERARRAGARPARLVYRARTAVRQRREVPDGRRRGRQRSSAPASGARTRFPHEHDPPRPRRREGAVVRPARRQHSPHPVPDRSRPRAQRERAQRARPARS